MPWLLGCRNKDPDRPSGTVAAAVTGDGAALSVSRKRLGRQHAGMVYRARVSGAARRKGEQLLHLVEIPSFLPRRREWRGRPPWGAASSAGSRWCRICRRAIRGGGGGDGMELLPQQQPDLSRIPARWVEGAARPRLVHGNMRPWRCDQC